MKAEWGFRKKDIRNMYHLHTYTVDNPKTFFFISGNVNLIKDQCNQLVERGKSMKLGAGWSGRKHIAAISLSH